MARTSVAHVLVAVVIAVAACSRGDGAGDATTETTADVPRAPALIEEGVPSCAVTALQQDGDGWNVDRLPSTAHLDEAG